jgi:TonB family protein
MECARNGQSAALQSRAFAALRQQGAGLEVRPMKISPSHAAILFAALASPAAAQAVADIPLAADDAMVAASEGSGEPDPRQPLPDGSPDDWVTNADYPIDAWRNGDEGFIAYDLDVDSAGAVTGCRITESMATPALDGETCRLLLERARFAAAQEENGQPTASVYSGYVVWERREPEFGSGSFTIKVAFTLDERGNISNCRVIERSGAIPTEMLRSFEREPCPRGAGRIPARDAEGRPVARDVVLTVSVEGTPAAPEGD